MLRSDTGLVKQWKKSLTKPASLAKLQGRAFCSLSPAEHKKPANLLEVVWVSSACLRKSSFPRRGIEVHIFVAVEDCF